MVRRYFLTALRALRSRPGFALINVLGLAVAMTCCLMIGLYVDTELRYDAFHDEADRLYQVGTQSSFFGVIGATPTPLASFAAEQVPGVESATRFASQGENVLQAEGNEATTAANLTAVDPSFLQMMTLPLQTGDAQTALQAPGQIVLTASTARRLFGSTSVVGETVQTSAEGEKASYEVAGVLAPLPETTTLAFDALISTRALENPEAIEGGGETWGQLTSKTYVKTRRPLPDDTLAARINHALRAHVQGKSASPPTFVAVSLPDVYMSELHAVDGFRGEIRYLYIFGTIALFILVIASVNYVNLRTAQAGERARSVGIRKAVGARRRQLIGQFVLESLLLGMTALGLAFFLLSATLPAYGTLFGGDVQIHLIDRWPVLLAVAGVVLGLSLLAALYPAWLLSRYNPAQVLRTAGPTTSSGRGWLRRGLVVVQFAIAAALIAGTAILQMQMDFVMTKDLGFDDEQVVHVDLPTPQAQRVATDLRDRVRAHPQIAEVSAASNAPGDAKGLMLGLPSASVSSQATTDEDLITFRPYTVDAEYISTLGLSLIAGRNFSAERSADAGRFILNRAGVEALGWTPEEAVGRSMDLRGGPREIVGVVENFHVESLREDVKPVVLSYASAAWSGSDGPRRYDALVAKLRPDDVPAAMDHFESVLADVAPGQPFAYVFVDERFDEMYRSDQRLQRLFTGFAGVALFIACLGLFGLAAFSAQQRTREIGIRKTLGASVKSLVWLLSKEFAVLVGVAVVLGTPAAYVGMQTWLEAFAFRIDLGPTPFMAAVGASVLIAGGSVSVHALRAARTDPARTLRSE